MEDVQKTGWLCIYLTIEGKCKADSSDSMLQCTAEIGEVRRQGRPCRKADNSRSILSTEIGELQREGRRWLTIEEICKAEDPNWDPRPRIINLRQRKTLRRSLYGSCRKAARRLASWVNRGSRGTSESPPQGRATSRMSKANIHPRKTALFQAGRSLGYKTPKSSNPPHKGRKIHTRKQQLLFFA